MPSEVDPHACGLIGQFGRCAAPKSGGAVRALGRPGGAEVYPHACGLINPFGRCAAPKSGGAVRALGRPGGAHVRATSQTPTMMKPMPSQREIVTSSPRR